jgi:diacylglycerol kinase (CTP)
MVSHEILEFELPQRSDMHWRRKIWHMSTVFVLFLIQSSLPHDIVLALFTLAWLTFVPLDFLRQRSVSLNQVLLKIFRGVVRRNEIHRLAGTTYLLTGVILIHLLFQGQVVSLSLLFLAFADPIASFFGIRFGRRRILNGKSLEGTLAAFLVCVFCCWLQMRGNFGTNMELVLFCFLGGWVGALAELFVIKEIDDNLTLPILSALGLWALLSVFS